jgi:hypothetical protein
MRVAAVLEVVMKAEDRRFRASCLRLCFLAVLGGLGGGAVQQVASPASARADDVKTRSLSTELRFRLFTTAYRWSSYRPEGVDLPNSGRRSLYLVPSVGVRFFPKSGHGVLFDADFRVDVDADADESQGLICILYCPPTLYSNFAVAHAGYAYRFAYPMKRERWALAVTPHASVAAGAAFSQTTGRRNQSFRSPVVGGRVGVDVDLHIKHFFMGWSLQYEALSHTKGGVRFSQFISWNVIPVFAIGAVIGRDLRQATDLQSTPADDPTARGVSPAVLSGANPPTPR